MSKQIKLVKGIDKYVTIEDIVKIKDSVQKSTESKMKYISDDNGSTYTDWQYYCRVVNDILDGLRHGRTEYCYNLDILKDILKYENNIDISLVEDDDFKYLELKINK